MLSLGYVAGRISSTNTGVFMKKITDRKITKRRGNSGGTPRKFVPTLKYKHAAEKVRVIMTRKNALMKMKEKR
jgi:hypothetical protein